MGPCAYSRLFMYTQQNTAGFNRGQQLGPVPHNTGHAAISTFIAYIKVYVETFSLHTSTSGIKSYYLFVLCRVKRNKHRSNTYRAVITQ